MKMIKKSWALILLSIISSLFILSPGLKASAAGVIHQFGGADPFGGAKYSLQNGKIITTIRMDTKGGTQKLTFSNSGPQPLVYTSDAQIFCKSQSQITPAGPATITLAAKPSGQTISGKLNVYYISSSDSFCNGGDSGNVSINNLDAGSGGGGGGGSSHPATITFSGTPYHLVDPAYNLYGLNAKRGGDCYGGSVIIVNSDGSQGTIYQNLTWTDNPAGSSLSALEPALVKDGFTDSHIANLTQGCMFKDGFDPSSSATGSITNGVLSATIINKDPAASTDTSACVFKTNDGALDKALSWILCPVISGLSTSADSINGFVEGQLNFDVNQNLSGSVQKSWTVFREITSAALVIVMLIIVFSQAVGGGPLDAYTIRKLLPRLAAAIILMQVSWYLCIWLIGLANAAGQGLADLMAVPFGGTGALDLPSLLHRLNPVWAALIGATSTAGAIIAIFFSGLLLSFGWPILVLSIILVLLAVVVALATLLFRNALIILLVMLSPLAFLAYVLPGTDRYWKIWKDNFIKLLVFFPLVIAIIYGGRIFAWTVGNAGGAGPLDLIIVLVGFFGPYFFLPKSFRWGGSLLAMASKGVNEAWPVKKGREVAGKELMAAQRRKQNELVDKYYQSLVRVPGNKKPGTGTRIKAGLRRGLVRTTGGHPIPTKRATRVMMQEAGKWKQDEIDLAEGKINNDYKEFQKGDPSHGKKAVRDKHYDPTGKNALQNRAFFTWGYNTKSFMEMGKKDWRTGEGRYDDMFKTQGWIDFLHGNGNAYGDFSSRLGTSVPYRLPLGGGPKAADYLPGGKRYDILGYEHEVEQNEDGTVKLDESGQPIYTLDGNGKTVPNIYYNPALKQIADAGGTRAEHLASLAADSERFTKLIDQAEDPAAVVAQRPELFAELKDISNELEKEQVKSVGKASLRAFIDKESTTLAGRNILQRLTGAAEVPIDAMFGAGYIHASVAPRRSDAEEIGVVAPAAAATAVTQAPEAGRPAQQAAAPPLATPAPAAATRATQAAEAPTATAGVQVDLGPAAAHFENLARASEAMNEAAYHMRRTADTQERAVRRMQDFQPGQQINVEHREQDENNGGNQNT
jgi:MFS family permease